MSIGSALLGAVLATVSVTGAGVVPALSGGVPPVSHQRGAGPSVPGRWDWPLDPRPEVVRRFDPPDPPDQPWLPGHRGVDLAASVGEPVLAPTLGRIAWTGVVAGRAVVVVSHEDGLRTTFEPVGAAPPVGTAVRRGEPVGKVTSTPGHCAPGTCLHWGVLRGQAYLNPLSFVGHARIVLLPLP